MKTNLCLLTLIVGAAALSCSKTTSQTVAVAPPSLGWSSWNAYFTEINDSIIRAQADFMVSLGLKDAGYQYVNIDDGFFGPRDAEGNMSANPDRFPNGMRPVVDYIHEKGLLAGIYSEHGTNTCGSIYNDDVLGNGAGLYGHDEQDIRVYFKDWDFDFIKIDGCGLNEPGFETESRYREIYDVMRKVIDKHFVLNIACGNFPGTWVRELGDSWRVSPDIRNRWSNIESIIRKNMYLSAIAGGGRYNDMDMMVVGYKDKPAAFRNKGLGITFNEEETHFGMWCIMSSPILLGCDLAYIPPETLEMVTNPELLAVNQDPLGLQAHVAWHEGDGYVLVKDLLTPHGNTRAVALYNPSDAPLDFDIPLEVVGFKGSAALRDLNRRQDLSTAKRIKATVPKHGARILKITGKHRVEPDTYEAEWAFIPSYCTVKKKAGEFIFYTDEPSASGQVVVTGLGGSEGACLEWNDVYRPKAGKHELLVHLSPDGDLLPEGTVLSVNGEAIPLDGNKAVVNLKKGNNAVRLANASTPLPPVDCFTLKQ